MGKKIELISRKIPGGDIDAVLARLVQFGAILVRFIQFGAISVRFVQFCAIRCDFGALWCDFGALQCDFGDLGALYRECFPCRRNLLYRLGRSGRKGMVWGIPRIRARFCFRTAAQIFRMAPHTSFKVASRFGAQQIETPEKPARQIGFWALKSKRSMDIRISHGRAGGEWFFKIEEQSA